MIPVIKLTVLSDGSPYFQWCYQLSEHIVTLTDLQKFVWLSKKGEKFKVVSIDRLKDAIFFRKILTNEIGSISQWDFLHCFEPEA